MELINGLNIYHVGKQVAQMEKYNLYICTKEGDDETEYLIQIAKRSQFNTEIQRNEYLLNQLLKISNKIDEEYRKKMNKEPLLNYQFFFPEIVDSFVFHEQGNRNINIIAFRNAKQVKEMIPLSFITERYELRVDLKTSAWIIGKTLKLLAMTQDECISTSKIFHSDNILIKKDNHCVTIFDWSNAHSSDKKLSFEKRKNEISQAAKATIKVLGGDAENRFIPHDDKEDGFREYSEYLFKLTSGIESNAQRAYENFYKLIDRLWVKKFHPFTTLPLTSKERV